MLEAVQLFAENPHLSNREVARRLGISEKTIRDWKKSEVWAEESQRVAEERADLALEVLKEQQQKYKEELRQELADLKKLRDAAKTNAALFFKMSNSALRELSTERDSLKGCGKALKNGVNRHSDSAIKASEAVMDLNKDIYQIDILLEKLDCQEIPE